MKIKVTRKLHQLWKGHQDAMKIEGYKAISDRAYPFGPIGKWIYHYESKKGKISLISFPPKAMMFNDKEIWEIYSRETLFQDVIRFDSKEQAEKEIRRYLE